MVTRRSSVDQAIGKMADYGVGCVIVEEHGKPAGILTERDMAALILEERHTKSLTMEEVMSYPVMTVQPDISTYYAVELMNRHKMRRLVVVDKEEKVVGLLMLDNIIKELEGNYVEFLKKIVGEHEKSLYEAKEALAEKSMYLESLLHSSMDMAIIATGPDFRITYFNPMAEMMFEYVAEEMVGRKLNSLFSLDQLAPAEFKRIEAVVDAEGEYCFSFSTRHLGRSCFVESRISNICNEAGEKVGYTLMSRDVTEKRLAEDKLLLASHVYESAIEGIMVTDAHGTIQSVNPAFTDITGYSESDVIGENPRILQSNRQPPAFYVDMWKAIRSEGFWQGEIWNRRKNGETYPERLTISSVKDSNGDVTQYTAVFYDITDIKASEEEVKYQAYHDPLTELPNRLLFKDRLSQSIAHAHRLGRGIAAMFLDIDHFKHINDSLGHYIGDLFLQQMSAKFRECLREGDTVSRFGGDEFTILMDEINGEDDAIVVAREVLGLFDQAINIDGNDIYSGASIGIALYPSDGDDAETLIRNADTAMYHAKALGRNNYQLFKSEMEVRIKQRVTLEAGLRKALARKEFELKYQPIIDLNDSDAIAMEVLIRWNRPSSGVVRPDYFIPIAEESGLIVAIGEWVLRQACHQGTKWRQEIGRDLSISINLSARQFRERELVKTVTDILNETGFRADLLNLEITETVMMDSMESSIATLKQLRAMGVQISMDDFGTGYSSFTYLKQFPVDFLKLDHTFIRDIVDDPDAARLAAGMISLAQGLNLQVVAEGIESEAQLEFLKAHGCDKVQGFLLYEPLSVEAMTELLRERTVTV